MSESAKVALLIHGDKRRPFVEAAIIGSAMVVGGLLGAWGAGLL